MHPLIVSEDVDREVGIFLNRLSDCLFVMGRVAVLEENQEEVLWVKAK